MVSRSNKVFYALLNFSGAAAAMPIVIYVLPYFATNLGMGLTTVGSIFILGRVLDLFTDPIMGTLIDRYPSRWGKHKHWIALSLPILMLSTVLLYLPINTNPSGWYFFFSLFLLYTGFTLSGITQLSWSVFLAPSYDDKTNLLTLREAVNVFFSLLVLAIPAFIELYFNAPIETKILAIGIFVLILLPVIVSTALIKVPDSKEVSAEILHPFKVFKTFFANKNLKIVVSAGVLVVLAQGAQGATALFVIDYVLNLPEYSARMILLYFFSSICGLQIWRKLALKKSKHEAAFICAMYVAVMSFIAYLGWEYYLIDNPQYMLIGSSIAFVSIGIAYAGVNPLIVAMVADLAKQDKELYGQDRSASMYSFFTLFLKFGNAFAASIPYLILGLFSVFDPVLGLDNTRESLDLLWNLYIFIPIICYTLAAFIIKQYKYNV